MSNTPRFALRAPDGPENADVPLYIRNLASDVDPWLSRAQPRTQAQISAISAPLQGQQVYNTDVNKTQEWNGSTWRSIGAGASGSVAVGTLSLTTTYQTVAYFIGLGFQEVNFTLATSQSVVGNGGAWVTAHADATRARGLGISSSTSSIFQPSTTTDYVQFNLAGNVNVRARNIRLDSDGFLRMELGMGTGSATTTATDRINWGAR